MATFSKGQRVKLLQHPRARPDYVGRVGAFVRYEQCAFQSAFDSLVLFDGDLEPRWGPSETLAPLTDPHADAFIEGIKKLGPLYVEPRVIEPQEIVKAIEDGMRATLRYYQGLGK